MPETAPTLLWLRRDLRLSDHPGWRAALTGGGPAVPVFVLDPETEAWGAAPLWRLGESLTSLARAFEARGSRLILRRGRAPDMLARLAAETGARRIVRSRLYDPASVARDREVQAALVREGLGVETVNAFQLNEPGEVETAQGGPYHVFSPYWRAIRGRDVPAPLPAPGTLSPPITWPASDQLAD